jgi:hypothetical protein
MMANLWLPRQTPRYIFAEASLKRPAQPHIVAQEQIARKERLLLKISLSPNLDVA